MQNKEREKTCLCNSPIPGGDIRQPIKKKWYCTGAGKSLVQQVNVWHTDVNMWQNLHGEGVKAP